MLILDAWNSLFQGHWLLVHSQWPPVPEISGAQLMGLIISLVLGLSSNLPATRIKGWVGSGVRPKAETGRELGRAETFCFWSHRVKWTLKTAHVLLGLQQGSLSHTAWPLPSSAWHLQEARSSRQWSHSYLPASNNHAAPAYTGYV